MTASDDFAESTVTATVWLVCHQPNRLEEWLNRHPDSERLRAVANERVAAARTEPDIIPPRNP